MMGEELKKRGITLLKASDRDVEHYIGVGGRARRMLVGGLFTEEFLNRVEKTVRDFRRSHSPTQ